MAQFKDLTGQRFGRLTILRRAESHIGPNGKKRTMWFCRCDCGSLITTKGENMTSNHTQSCGCYATYRRTTHGLSHHRLHNVWNGIEQRCNNLAHKAYANYGGRGINICDEWKNDFKIFYDFAMANGWKQGLQIDRINNNGDYEPNNCRFVTQIDNIRNSRAAKLTAREVLDIRSAFADKRFGFTRIELAIAYGIKKCQISNVISGRSWAGI